ncbi:MAG: hypothetical protein ABI947_15685 [Chloroflexota bacterium]
MDTRTIPLTCPNCNGKLLPTADPERFVCMYCGTEQIILRSNRTNLQMEISTLENELSELDSLSAFSSTMASKPSNGLFVAGQVIFGLLGGVFLCFALLMLVPTPSDSTSISRSNTTASTARDNPPSDGVLATVCGVPALIFFAIMFVIRRASRTRQSQNVTATAGVPAANAQLAVRRQALQSSLMQKRAELASYQRNSGT